MVFNFYIHSLLILIFPFCIISEAKEDYGEILFLSPYLDAGKIEEAQNLSRVSPDIGNLTSYSGFLTVDKECESFLFFWFFPAQEGDWKSAPVILWQQGGPGASSFLGLFLELGPFQYSKDAGLTKRKYAWNNKNNLLFIDNPTGVGFSFTRKNCYPKNVDEAGTIFLSGLKEFYRLFPALQPNKFILSGESYSGRYLPVFTSKIHEHNISNGTKINLTAVLIGSGFTHPLAMKTGLSELYYYHGLIDHDQRAQYLFFENLCLAALRSNNLRKALDYCNPLSTRFFHTFIGPVNIYNLQRGSGFDEESFVEFIELPSTRKALHVGKQLFNAFSDKIFNKFRFDYYRSVEQYLKQMLSFYPFIYVYGENDLICPYVMGAEFLRSLVWNNQTQYAEAQRILWVAEEDIVGYYKGTYNLYDVMLRDCGHYFPRDQPNSSYILINSVATGSPKFPLKELINYDNL